MIENTRVLIVDDNESLSRSMSSVLKRKGCSVETASDGVEAINTVKKKSFDVIFMDIRMPGLNGVEALEKIKKISPAIKVVMMTAYALEELVDEAFKEKTFGVLYKPVDMDKVFEMIESIRFWNQQPNGRD